MQARYTVLFRIVPVLVLLNLLFGCSFKYADNVGRMAVEEQILSGQTTAEDQEWQTNDVKILYTVEPAKGSFAVTGTLSFQQHIMFSFPTVERFNLYINYLDDQGTVLTTHDITPNLGYRVELPDKADLRDVPVAPAEATSFAFNYFGIFKGLSTEEASMGDWVISFNPFQK